ncbi:MAG: M48 family metallopeptidase [Reichenbachiella sp.]|uniref:M48 family metallopeptidase n=1 Tax=Reichenbachiella sp. TaxID=2184521 RepID=UPI0032649E93
MKYFSFLSLFVAGLLLVQCATVPVTGRKQLSTVKNDEIIPMSFAQYEQVIKEAKLSDNKGQSAMIKRVGSRIQKAVELYAEEQGFSEALDGFNWEFNLIDNDSTVNAWCMPGGKVAFYTGIMPICKNETGVAVVMGHEVAHAVASHGRERMSQGMVAQLGLGSLQVAMGSNPTGTQELLMQSIGAGTQLGMLKFSRTHESEADKIGLIFMAIAGYNPKAAPKFWERMAAGSGGQAPPEWQSTHPSHDTRISDLNAQLPKAMEYYKKYKKD